MAKAKRRRHFNIIHIEGCQIKSAEKLRKVCAALNTLEEEIGIHEVTISFKDMFICPWIDLTEFTNSNNPMERLIGGLCVQLDIKKNGKKSPYIKTSQKRK